MIVVCAAEGLRDFDCDDPDRFAERIVSEVAVMVLALPKDELDVFYEQVYGWVCDHRAQAALDAEN
jgi:hypothetical protein